MIRWRSARKWGGIRLHPVASILWICVLSVYDLYYCYCELEGWCW